MFIPWDTIFTFAILGAIFYWLQTSDKRAIKKLRMDSYTKAVKEGSNTDLYFKQ